MSRLCTWLQAVGIGLAALMVFAAPAAGGILLDDQFDSPLNTDIWTIQRGAAWTEDGWLVCQSPGGVPRDAFVMTGMGGPWSDYTFRTRFFADGGAKNWYMSIILFRVQDLHGWSHGRYYGLAISTPLWQGEHSIYLNKMNDEEITDLALIHAPAYVNPQDNEVEITVDGGHIVVLVNNQPAIDLVDPDPILTGGIALASIWESRTRYDYATVDMSGNIWRVPSIIPTIGAGLAAAVAGDAVVAACGTYYEHDLILKPGVLLQSETSRADCVIIDAQHQGRVLSVMGAGDVAGVVGVTLRGGSSSEGAGMYMPVPGSALMLNNCRFVANAATGRGGGLAIDEDCVARLTHCDFDSNVSGAGGAIAANAASLSVSYSQCRGNVATSGGASYCEHSSSATFDHCTFAGNECEGSAVVSATTGSDIAMTNSLEAFNKGRSLRIEDATVTLTDCDLYGNTQGDWIDSFAEQVVQRGNFAANPCFCGAEAGELTLCADSFCLPENHPWGGNGLVGARGQGCSACDCQGPVAVILHSFDVRAEGAAVTITWRVDGGAGVEDFHLTGTQGGYQWDVPVKAGNEGAFTAHDGSPTLARGDLVTYSLYHQTGGRGWELLRTRELTLPPPLLNLCLGEAMPNPFNPRTKISYGVPRSCHVMLAIYDVRGTRVATLVDADLSAGERSAEWSGANDKGMAVPSGIYFARLETTGGVRTVKLTLAK